MKQCKFSEMAHRYADGELSPDDAKQFKQHAGECPVCGELLRDIKGMKGIFAKRKPVDCPVDLEEKIKAAIKDTPRERTLAVIEWNRFSKSLLPVAACFSLMLCSILYFFIYINTGNETEMESQSIQAAAEQARNPRVAGYFDSALTDSEKKLLVDDEQALYSMYLNRL